MWAASDDALLAGMSAGDRDAAVVFVRRFQRRVFGLALSVTSDPGTAEDVAQEAFVRAWRAAPTYDGRKASVATWLLTITRNLAIDAVRARRCRPMDPDDLLPLLPASADGVDQAAPRTDTELASLRAAVRALPDEQRRVLLLAVIGGLTAAEISGREGIPLGTAKTRLRTALRKLRAGLVPEGGRR